MPNCNNTRWSSHHRTGSTWCNLCENNLCLNPELFFALQLNSDRLTDRLPSPHLAFGMKTIALWQCRRKRKRSQIKKGARDKREKAGGGWRQSETERQHNLEFTANVLVCWDLSEPSLSLILLWILKYPHISISLLNSLPPTSSYSFSLSLFFIQPLVFILLLDVHDALLSVFHLLLLSLHHSENGIRVLSWSCENTSIPLGSGCRRAKLGEGGTLFVVSHWIFHLNPWNIHRWGQD